MTGTFYGGQVNTAGEKGALANRVDAVADRKRAAAGLPPKPPEPQWSGLELTYKS